jgi:hypothetical protein
MLADIVHQPDLFAADRWPRRPYCTDDLAAGLRIRSLASALRCRYIQANPPYLRVWSIHDCDYEGAAIAWEDANLPPPAWISVNRENGHAHHVWGLSAPVLVEGLHAREAPMRYLAAIESMMREKLRADPGFSGLVTKNPAHPHWRLLIGPPQARGGYELRYLAEWLPGVERHIPRRGRPEEIGLGRNCALFDHLRTWAYRHVRPYRAAGGLDAWNAWLAACVHRALERNGEFPVPLDARECWWIARSVARWTWQRFDLAASDRRFSERQAHRGRAGGIAKGQANEDKRAAARLMAAKGMSQRAIAAALGVPRTTVQYWLDGVDE